MMRFQRLIHHLTLLTRTLSTLVVDGLRYLLLCLRPSPTLAAENLFLRKQLALYRERGIKPRRITHATRLTLVWLAHWFDWRQALAVVQPATFLRWHRQGFRLFWRWTSGPGRPAIPTDLRALIRRMARDNPSWGEERIANERLLKLGLCVSPRTVRKYLPKRLDHGWHRRVPSQRWRTFVRNHALAIVARDFCWVQHHNQGRPHMSLGPGIPQPPPHPPAPLQAHRHWLPAHLRVVGRPILGGLQHEYRLEKKVA
jgi:putative transposase